MTEPTTKAGRALLDAIMGLDAMDGYSTFPMDPAADIAAIEAEAREQEREELRHILEYAAGQLRKAGRPNGALVIEETLDGRGGLASVGLAAIEEKA